MGNHILYVTPFFPPYDRGGMEISLKLLSETFARKGWRVTVATPGYGEKAIRVIKGNPEIVYVPWSNHTNPASIFTPFAIKRFARYCLNAIPKPDLIDTYSWPRAGLRLGKLWRVPVVASIRDASIISDLRDSPKPKRIFISEYFRHRLRRYRISPLQIAFAIFGYWRQLADWKALANVDHVTYASNALKELFKDLPTPGTTIYSCTTLPAKLPRLSIPQRNHSLPLFVFAGRLGKGKGAQLLLEAATHELRKKADFQCVFIGQGELEAAIRKTEFPNHVLFLGRRSREEVLVIMKQARATIVPSQVFEGFPRSAIESISVGVPVIGTTVGGIPEAVSKAGLLVPPTAYSLGKAVRILVGDHKEISRLKAIARAQAQKYTPNNAYDRVAPIYSGLLKKKLAVMMALGSSLKDQSNSGQDTRFINYYLKPYAEHFSVDIFSYAAEAPSLPPNVNLYPNRWRLHRLFYAFMMPFLYSHQLKSASGIRVMQMTGALPAVLAKWALGIPFVATYGYCYSDLARVVNKPVAAFFLSFLEWIGSLNADKIIVTNPVVRDYLIAKRRIAPQKIVSVPNGVDTAAFHPINIKPKQRWRLLSVGRLENEKNYLALINAVSQSRFKKKIEIIIIGQGSLEQQLIDQADRHGIKLTLKKPVPYDTIAKEYQRADIFILPSLSEGQPKVLIEAMAVGLPCIGTPCPGIKTMLKQKINGMITTGFEASHLVKAVDEILTNFHLAQKLGQNARETACKYYDLRVNVQREIKILNRVARAPSHDC